MMNRALQWMGVLILLSVYGGPAYAVTCQDNIPPSNPDAIYVDNGDGTVTDTRTGLMWKQCAEGLSGSGCATGTAQAHIWAEALSQAETSGFAGHGDWRLPNIKELLSLVEECGRVPTINDALFPNTPIAYFWSGSPDAYYSDFAWIVFFYNGYSDVYYRTDSAGVRLVRGGQ